MNGESSRSVLEKPASAGKAAIVALLAGLFLLQTSCVDTERKPRSGIWQAIDRGDVESARTIMENTPEVVRDRIHDQSTPLHQCAKNTAVAALYLKSGGKNRESYRQDVDSWLAKRREIAALLLSRGAEVNARDYRLRTPLYWAACSANLELAALLLDSHANPDLGDSSGMTPLHIVALSGDTAFAKLLLGRGADVNARDSSGTPLINAVEEHKEMVSLLLEKGADVHERSADDFAPIHLAGNSEIAGILFSRGALLEARGFHRRTPLHQAAMRNRNDLVEWLCDKNVDVNAVDADGQTPLAIATSQVGDTREAMELSLKTVLILLRHGADPNLPDKKGSPLFHDAVFRQWQDLVTILVTNGADINARNKLGESALHLAVSQKNAAMIELLVALGADGEARDSQNKTPYDVLIAQHLSGQETEKIAVSLRGKRERINRLSN